MKKAEWNSLHHISQLLLTNAMQQLTDRVHAVRASLPSNAGALEALYHDPGVVDSIRPP